MGVINGLIPVYSILYLYYYSRRETAPVLLDEKAPKKRQKLEHTSSTKASGTLKVPKFTQYDKNPRHDSASTSTPTAPSLPSKPTGTRPFIATQAIRQAHQKDCDTPALDSPVLPPFAGGMKASPLTRSMLVVRDNPNAPMGQQSMAGPSPPAHLILKENQPPPTLRGESASLGIYQAQVMTPLDVVLLKDKLVRRLFSACPKQKPNLGAVCREGCGSTDRNIVYIYYTPNSLLSICLSLPCQNTHQHFYYYL